MAIPCHHTISMALHDSGMRKRNSAKLTESTPLSVGSRGVNPVGWGHDPKILEWGGREQVRKFDHTVYRA